MRKWWTSTGMLLGVLLCLGGILTPASAQFSLGNLGSGDEGSGPPPGYAPPQEKASPLSMKDDGNPNAFTDCLTYRPRSEPYVFTFSGQYLNWHVTPGPSNAVLLTTNSNFPTETGALNEQNTTRLVNSGSTTFDYPSMPGFRLSAAIGIGYLPPIEVSGFLIQHDLTAFSGGSLTNPTRVLAIPFQDVSTFVFGNIGTETAQVIEAPLGSGSALGGVVSIVSRLSLWGIEANFLIPFGESDVFKLDGILGYRHAQLNESLGINTTSGGNIGTVFFLGSPAPAGFSVATADRFQTRNSFDGGQLGLRSVFTITQRLSIASDLKLALGVTNHTLSIDGSSTLNQAVAGRPSTTVAGGILALPSNSGSFTFGDFGVISEGNIALRCQLTSNLRILGGFNAMYWTNVIRPGDAVSNIIDKRQIPTNAGYVANVNYNGPGVPGFVHRDFLAQGFFVGLEFGF